MVWNYQNADCSFENKFIVLFIIIFGTPTLSFPIQISALKRKDAESSIDRHWPNADFFRVC